MWRIGRVAIALGMLASSAMAAGPEFFSGSSGPWTIKGYKSADGKNPACAMQVDWADGSNWAIYKDLKDDEIYFIVQNVDWFFPESVHKKTGSARLNFYFGQEVIGAPIHFEVLGKDTIRMRNVESNKFTPMFMKGTRMALIMPDNYQNIGTPLRGSSEAVMQTLQCIESAKRINLYPELPSADVKL